MSCYFWPFDDRPCPYEQKPRDEHDDGCSQSSYEQCLGDQLKKEQEEREKKDEEA